MIFSLVFQNPSQIHLSSFYWYQDKFEIICTFNIKLYIETARNTWNLKWNKIFYLEAKRTAKDIRLFFFPSIVDRVSAFHVGDFHRSIGFSNEGIPLLLRTVKITT